MGWLETDVMDQRRQFVVLAVGGGQSMSALCRSFGVSRKTGYKWLRRYREAGSVAALSEESRRPRSSPMRTDASIEKQVCDLRRQYGWGSKKLMELLPSSIDISRSTVDRILKRHGLTRSSSSSKAIQRFERSQPNELWQMDFKGQYPMVAGDECFPLTILDDHSRYSLEVRALTGTAAAPVKDRLVHTFREYGLPKQMLIDHGTPWWSPTMPFGLTHLSVSLIEQGIDLIYGAVAHPQTRGKIERFHRTLNEYLDHHGKPTTQRGFQRRFSAFRKEYNELRPHEALEMKVPASRYRKSARLYRPHPRAWDYPDGADLRRLNSQGILSYDRRRYFVSEALAGKDVWCQQYDGKVLVTYRQMQVREIDLRTFRTTAVVRKARKP